MKKRLSNKAERINDQKGQMREAMMMDPARERRLAMIQMLIPLGLSAVEEERKNEVESLVGPRYSERERWDAGARIYDQSI